MGVGGALIMPATLSIITNVFPREERAKAIGVWAGTAAIGVGLGPLFGGLLLEYFDWSSVFLINVPVALVAFVAGIRFVPDSRDPNPGRFDAPGALLSIGALVALIYAVIEAPERGWLDPVILGAFGGALALGAAFVAWELRTAAPMLDLSLFRNPRFSIGSLSISLAFFSLFGAIFALTQFLQFAKDYSPLEAGAAMVPLAFGLMLGATRSAEARRALRHHPRGGRRAPGPRRDAGDDAAVDERHALLADRPVVLRRGALHGLHHGAGDRTRSWARCPRRRRASRRR